MDQDSAHMVAASKVHMLKPGEYEIWRINIEQYIQMIDYAVWEGVVTVMPITTAKEKALRRLEVKARSTLLMVIPNEHQLKFIDQIGVVVVSAIETSSSRRGMGIVLDLRFDLVFSLRLMMLGEVDKETLGLACGVLLICSFDLDLCSAG
ncbi:hypothetical protein Tco_0073013 [Tanacetum coccineum]